MMNTRLNRILGTAAFALGLMFALPGLAAGPAATSPDPATAAVVQQVPLETVNINTADAPTLARVLKGIGESKAAAIVQYREENGAFVDVHELANVKGVGERTVELNADRMVLKD